MKAIHIMLFCAAGIFFSACGTKTEAPAKEATATETPTASQAGIQMAATALGSPKDLVCGMPMKDGAIADTANYEGKAYGFCSAECKGEFKKEPAKYLTQK